VPGGLCVAPHIASEVGKYFFDEEGVKVFISKNCWKKYLARNLLPAERFSKSC